MTLIEDIQIMAFAAADLLNNLSDKISNEYKLGYAQGVLDSIVQLTKPEIEEK